MITTAVKHIGTDTPTIRSTDDDVTDDEPAKININVITMLYSYMQRKGIAWDVIPCYQITPSGTNHIKINLKAL